MYSKVDKLEGIYYMLEVPGFLDTYLAGDFKPEKIADFGKTHQIVINRQASADGDPPE